MVFTTVSVLETVSALVTGPIYAAVFRASLSRGGHWLGIPSFLGSALIGLGGLLLYYVSKAEQDPEQE